MFLSNPVKSFLLAAFFLTFIQACGSSPGNENRPILPVSETKSEYPFSTKEPEIYQGEFVINSGETESLWFIARKNEKWRFDIFRGSDKWLSKLVTDRSYTIDHRRMVYAADAGNTDAFDGIKENFFNGKEYREFDDLGLEGNLRKFKIREDASRKGEITIYIDEPSGMIVKQEFVGQSEASGTPIKYVYEIRNLKLNVDDSVFAIPSGYREVTWDEFRRPKINR